MTGWEILLRIVFLVVFIGALFAVLTAAVPTRKK